VEINVCVHLVDEASSPSAGGMWRWAVHTGADFSDKTTCLNAGAEESETMAMLRGQQVAVAAAKLVEHYGDTLTGAATVVLDHDPVGSPWPLIDWRECL
jgi:hypothetical protein